MKLDLPRSGLRIDGPSLRIERPHLPVIELDARLLDDVQPERDRGGMELAVGLAATGVTGLGAALVGGPVVFVPAVLAILTSARAARWYRGDGQGRLLLTLGTLRVGLQIADGPTAAARAAAALAPFTRRAPLSDPTAYEALGRRLEAALAGRPPPDRGEEPGAVSVGAERVRVEGDELHIGGRSVPVQTVRQLAQVGDNLPLGPHVALQAALALLVVAAEERRTEIEDPQALRARLAEYERWSGRLPGR